MCATSGTSVFTTLREVNAETTIAKPLTAFFAYKWLDVCGATHLIVVKYRQNKNNNYAPIKTQILVSHINTQ